MTPYPHIIARLTSDIWAITADAYESLWSALENHVQQRSMALATEPWHPGDDPQAGPTRQAPRATGVRAAGSGISIVDIAGVIGKRLSSMESMCGGVSVDAIVGSVKEAVADPNVGTVIMNWHSPGGSVTGVPEAYDELVKLSGQKTLISYTDTKMCSGAQWLASAASSVYAAGTADVGSVGVYQLSLDRTVQLAQQGVKVEAIHAGKFKLMGAPFKPMTNEERNILQARCDDIHQQFKSAVSRGRPKLDQSSLEGQVLSGHQAKSSGLIDGIYPTLNSLVRAVVDTQR